LVKNPTIKYSVIRSRIQTKNDCAVFTLCRYMEQKQRLKGINVEFKARDLEEKLLMCGAKKGDTTGTSVAKALDYLKENGFQGYEIKRWRYLPKNVSILRLRLAREPFMFTLTCWRGKKDRINNGEWRNYPRTKARGTTHSVMCIGWDDGFIIQDPNYDFTYILKEEDFKDVRAVYSLQM